MSTVPRQQMARVGSDCGQQDRPILLRQADAIRQIARRYVGNNFQTGDQALKPFAGVNVIEVTSSFLDRIGRAEQRDAMSRTPQPLKSAIAAIGRREEHVRIEEDTIPGGLGVSGDGLRTCGRANDH